MYMYTYVYIHMQSTDALLLTDKHLAVMEGTTLETRFKMKVCDIGAAATRGSGVLVTLKPPSSSSSKYFTEALGVSTAVREVMTDTFDALQHTTRTATHYNALQHTAMHCTTLLKPPSSSSSKYCSEASSLPKASNVLQRGAVCCSALQCVAVCCSALQCSAVCRSVPLQFVMCSSLCLPPSLTRTLSIYTSHTHSLVIRSPCRYQGEFLPDNAIHIYTSPLVGIRERASPESLSLITSGRGSLFDNDKGRCTEVLPECVPNLQNTVFL